MKLDVPFKDKNSLKQEILKRFDEIENCSLEHLFLGHYKLIKKDYLWFFEVGKETVVEIEIEENMLRLDDEIKKIRVEVTIKKKGNKFVEQIMNILMDLEEKFEESIEIIVHANFKHPMFDKIRCVEEL